MKKYWPLFPCLIFVLSCEQKKSTPPVAVNPVDSAAVTLPGVSVAGWKTYKYETHGEEEVSYSIQYPPGWTIDTSGAMNSQFIFTAPADSGTYPANLNFFIQPHIQPPYNDLKKFTLLSIGQLKQNLVGCNIEENRNIKKGSDEYQELVYSGNYKHAGLKAKQVYRIVHGDAYIFTFTDEVSDYAAKVDTADAILNSFRYK